MLKALASSGRIGPHVRFRKEVRRRPEREPETGKEKLENGDSKSEGGVVFQFLVSNFHFAASRLTLHGANCYIRMRLWRDLEASEEWLTF
jgi:hypothetical protein